MADAPACSPPRRPIHLVVLQHGLWGNTTCVSNLEKFLRQHLGQHESTRSSTADKAHDATAAPGQAAAAATAEQDSDHAGQPDEAEVQILNSDVNRKALTYDGKQSSSSCAPSSQVVHQDSHASAACVACKPTRHGAHDTGTAAINSSWHRLYKGRACKPPCKPPWQCCKVVGIIAGSCNLACNHAIHLTGAPHILCYLQRAGIDVCGARVVKMILDCIQLLQSQGRQVTKLSFIGYSLGGLILRYAQWFTSISMVCTAVHVHAVAVCVSHSSAAAWGASC